MAKKKKLQVEEIAERVSELVKEFTDAVEEYQSCEDDMTPELPPLSEYDDDGMFEWSVDELPLGGDVPARPAHATPKVNAVVDPLTGRVDLRHSPFIWDNGEEPELDEEPGTEESGDKVNVLFELTVTRTQLVHLRDLFSVLLSFEDETSLSHALAKKEGRELAESRLWNKIHELCEEAEIPLDETAPDFVVGLTENPKLGLFTLEPDDLEEPEE